ERATDIPLLVLHFIRKFNTRLKKEIDGVEPEALAKLCAYPWPGNIRELENVIERAVLFCDGHELHLKDLPAEVRGPSVTHVSVTSPSSSAIAISELSQTTPLPPPSSDASGPSDGLKEQVKAAMSRLERELIIRALEQTSGNVTHAARLLKISRKGLQLKMKELGLREQGERGEG